MNELIETITQNMSNAFSGKSPFLYLKNPRICYNPKNVVGVEFSYIATGEIENMIKEAQKRIGFKKD